MPENIQEKIEDRLIDYININARGRLIIFKSEKKLKGVNLVVKKKGEYESKRAVPLEKNPIVKSQVFGARRNKSAKTVWLHVLGQNKASRDTLFKKDIDITEFADRTEICFLFIFFNVLKQDIDDYVCFISLEQFEKLAPLTKKNIYHFESFLSPERKDKYSDFLVNKKDLAKIFLSIILPE
jgi:hypothetical protein